MQFLRKFSAQAKETRWNRWRIIFDMLEDRHVVPISELIQATGEKASTIERDIETLSSRQLVRKTVKGGLTLENYHGEKPHEERTGQHQMAKSALARMAAAKYVTDGMTLFADGSTTVQAIAPFLSDRSVTVITNGLSLIADLRSHQFPGDIICTGGQYRARSNTVVGRHAQETLSHCHADLAIIGVEGISSQLELMEAHPAEALIKQTYLERADKSLVLALPHKFNEDALLSFAHLRQVTALISSSFTDAPFLEAARQTSVRLECPAGAQS